MAIYYVKNNGNNNNTGLSDVQAWQTISKINGRTFSAGDQILFNKGDVWREILTIPSSGTVIDYIVFSSYGTGAKPKILGSVQALAFTDQGGSIWKSATSVNDPYTGNIAQIFFEQPAGIVIWGTHKTSTGALVSEYDWTWSGNYIYVYAATDPDARYTSIEVPQNNFCISLNNQEYITIDGLEVQFARYSGIDFQGTYPNLEKHGLIIRNCYASYFGAKDGVGFGIDVAYSDMLIQNNVIHDCGRRGISIYCYGAITVENVIVENNTLYNGFHTTGVDISAGYTAETHYDNFTVRNNLIYDDPARDISAASSILMFVQCYKQNPSTITNLFIYNNIFKHPSMSALQMEGVNGVYIYNNIFYNFNQTVSSPNAQHLYVSLLSQNVVIKNNIFYSDMGIDLGSLYTTVATSNIILDYNIYYRPNNTSRIVQDGTKAYEVYHMNDLASLRSIVGWETHGQFIDPTFVSTTNYHLQAGSPAIGTGVYLNGVVDTDFDGNARSNPPSIGAYEYGSNPPTTSSLTIGSTPITDIKIGSTQITKVIRNDITYWQV